MASSISGKTLTVTINESITLGSDNFGNRTQFQVTNITDVSQRVMTVPTHEVSVMVLSASAGAGTFASGVECSHVSSSCHRVWLRTTMTL